MLDDRSLLRYVLPPEASARVGTTSTRETEAIRLSSSLLLTGYDRFGRLILKAITGL